jgi:hypothetical protein
MLINNFFSSPLFIQILPHYFFVINLSFYSSIFIHLLHPTYTSYAVYSRYALGIIPQTPLWGAVVPPQAVYITIPHITIPYFSYLY